MRPCCCTVFTTFRCNCTSHTRAHMAISVWGQSSRWANLGQSTTVIVQERAIVL